MKPVVYKSKISAAIVIPLGLLLAITTTVCFINHIWFVAAFLSLLLIFVLSLFLTIAYTISGDVLYIKAGFLYHITISIASIRKIQETSNPISSPAASLDRLAISFGKWDTVLISPKNKTDFIAHLLKINPAISIQLKKPSTK